ncbi:uncharacterized protein [Drosophila virilis]|uniref:uncharacterized protein n=1 Tax=Drosophila virilis TaxID=7244 RepID=UPI0013962DED|nr:uncharacterized protein LOC6629493 [Drosophila virilis]
MSSIINMYVSIQVMLLLVLTAQHKCLGFYIRNNDESPANVGATSESRNNEWGILQNRLGLSHEKVELLKSQKDQQGTKKLLHRFIMENPKYISTPATTNKKKRPSNQFKRLFQALANNFDSSKSTLKTTFKFELTDRPLKSLKRGRRKIAVNMVSDMSSEGVDQLLQSFYLKHNIEQSNYDNDKADRSSDNGDYSDMDILRSELMDTDSDYAYDNLYEDEGDVALTAKSHQNSEYGSFQDLILQAKRNQWETENEETKLHSPINDHFI